MDALHADGVTAGFIAFSLDGFTGENRTQRIFAFREALEAKLEKACGPDVVRMVGGATGVHFGYVDFMAWDLQPVLFEARAFLEASDVPAASFHVFRREVGSVPLKSPDDRADAGEDDDDEPLDYRPEMAEAFHARIQKWNDDDEYTRCIRALDGDYRHAYALARALENYAVLGDGQYGCPRDKAREALRRAIDVLESVREEGLDRAEWHMRMAYGYQYLTGEEEKAIPYARTWAQLDPEDEDAPCVIRECEKAVEARCKNDGKPVDRKGVFLGFVLLEKAHWDKGRLIADLKAEWDIDVPEEDKDDRKDNGDSLVFEAGDMIAAVSLMHGPVPGGEAEDNAENNYMWPDAVKAAQSHAAHIMVTVLIHAVSRIGVERNFSDEIQDEAYLFLPFDEDYYREMARIIERRYENWAGQRFDDSTLAPSETAEALMAYLDCECTYFPSMADEDPIMCAYEHARKNAAHEGFVPMLIAVDETLWECLMLNSDPAHEGDDDHAFDPDAVAAYRQSQLAAPLPDGRMVLEDGLAERRAEAEDDSMDWDTEVVGSMEGGFNNHRFSGYWNSSTGMTHPVILARIPVRHPWEVFAHLPFGNRNDCPDTPQLMAVARYWFEKFGAAPAVMTHDELDFALPKPIGREHAVQTALEQYAFCPDMDQNHESVGALADTLRQSKIWYFWWD